MEDQPLRVAYCPACKKKAVWDDNSGPKNWIWAQVGDSGWVQVCCEKCKERLETDRKDTSTTN